MSRTLLCVFLFSALFAVAFGDYRLIKGPENFQNQSSCVAQNGNKYYIGMLTNSEGKNSETAIFSLNFTSGKTERIFPDFLQRWSQFMSKEGESLRGLTTEHSGSPVLICAGNKLLFEMTLEKRPADFTREHRTHMIFDFDLNISPAQTKIQS